MDLSSRKICTFQTVKDRIRVRYIYIQGFNKRETPAKHNCLGQGIQALGTFLLRRNEPMIRSPYLMIDMLESVTRVRAEIMILACLTTTHPLLQLGRKIASHVTMRLNFSV